MIDIISEDDNEYSVFMYIPNFLDYTHYNLLKNELEDTCDWKIGISSDGNQIQRSQKWFQMDNQPFCKNWKHQFERWQSHEYTNILLDIQKLINKSVVSQIPRLDSVQIPKYNSLLINYYENGTKLISPHKDNHISFGKYPTISNLSIGETRTFILERTHKDKLNRNKDEIHLNRKYILEDNSLFVMAGTSQKYYCHYIPKEVERTNSRYSLTYREYI